jgi:hypothetical protein
MRLLVHHGGTPMKSFACLALMFAACSSSNTQSSAESRLGESCMTNTDCTGEVCANNVCLPPHPAGDGGVTLCSTSADCSMSDQCVVGVCLPGSIPIPNLDAGVPALPDAGVALPGVPTGFGTPCDPANACPGALVCFSGFCLPQLCKADADCTVGKCTQHLCQ